MYSSVTDSSHKFAPLGTPNRIWAVSAVNGEAERLMALHDTLFPLIQPGDRLLYLGNYIGHGPQPAQTIDELLTFRRTVLALPGVLPSDITYLRGGQEEMWQKLTQLQFARNPVDTLLWMLGNGLSSTLTAYGLNPHDGLEAAQGGVMSLTRWTSRVRNAVRRKRGHEIFTSQWRRAAFTTEKSGAPLLFVHAGINPARPLGDQGDSFWWAGKNFNDITLPYDPFQKVVRGYDPNHGGLHLNCVTATIDGGCGFGGDLICAGFGADGQLFELLEI